MHLMFISGVRFALFLNCYLPSTHSCKVIDHDYWSFYFCKLSRGSTVICTYASQNLTFIPLWLHFPLFRCTQLSSLATEKLRVLLIGGEVPTCQLRKILNLVNKLFGKRKKNWNLKFLWEVWFLNRLETKS